MGKKISQDGMLVPKKDRVAIPIDVSARVLFESDRTCCVCRKRKPLQIHHIDENPANNDLANLAALCFDCHRETQIRGGFDRKLDAEQVRLYRDHWCEQVRRYRTIATPEGSFAMESAPSADVRIIAAELEIHKAKEDWYKVAQLYHRIGDTQLRDRYIELVLQQDPIPFYVYLCARMQGKVAELSRNVIEAAIEHVSGDWTVRAGILAETGNITEAAKAYLDGIKNEIDEGNWFCAAYYMRHGLDKKIVNPLFKKSLREAATEDDLWWQLRALEELGWDDGKRELLLGNETFIRQSQDLLLIRELGKIKADKELVLKTAKEMSELGTAAYIRPVTANEDDDNDEGEGTE